MRQITKFIILSLIVSYAFLAQAAKIVFHNKTGKILTIRYRKQYYDDIVIEPSKSGEAKAAKAQFGSNITTMDFKFKISEDKEESTIKDGDKLKTYTMTPFVKPDGTVTKYAICDDFERNIYIEGYGNGDITDDNYTQEPTGWIKSAFQKTLDIFGSITKGSLSIAGVTIKKISSISDPTKLIGTTKDIKDTSIRYVKEKNKGLIYEKEIAAFKERTKKIKEPQQKFLTTDFLPNELPLCIGFAGSGGGTRARISTTGFVKGAVDIRLLECVTYFSALSGSTWMLAPWLIKKPNITMQKFIDVVVSDSGKINGFSIKGITLPSIPVSDTAVDFARLEAWDRPHGIINMYGTTLSKSFLKDLPKTTGIDYRYLYLSDIQEKVEKGDTIIPIFEVRAKRTDEDTNKITHESCHFTPWEFGGRYFGANGAYINIKTFGNKFRDNEALPFEITKGDSRIGPEPDLGLIMGVCGSAIAAPFTTLTGDTPTENISERFTLQPSIFYHSLINCEFNNFMQGNRNFAGYQDLPKLYLYDAGVVANLPIVSLYRQPENKTHGIQEGASPDIIFIFDASDTSDGEIGDELIVTQNEMLRKGLPFPKIKTATIEKNGKRKEQLDLEIIDEIKENSFYIFDENPNPKIGGHSIKTKYEDWEVPTVIYMTLVPGASYKNFMFSFEKFNTFNFKYDEKDSLGLIELTENIVKKNVDAIKIAMGKRKILNLKKDIEFGLHKEKTAQLLENEKTFNQEILNFLNEELKKLKKEIEKQEKLIALKQNLPLLEIEEERLKNKIEELKQIVLENPESARGAKIKEDLQKKRGDLQKIQKNLVKIRRPSEEIIKTSDRKKIEIKVKRIEIKIKELNQKIFEIKLRQKGYEKTS